MTRLILVLSAAAAAIALAACQQPSVLAKAQSGECYQVVGKDSLGQAKLAKTACAQAAAGAPSQDAQAADASKPGAQTASVEEASAAGEDSQASSSAVCPKICQGAGPGSSAPSYIASSKVRASKAVYSSHRRRVRARTGGEEGLGIDYVRASDIQSGGSDTYGSDLPGQYVASGLRGGYDVQSSTSYSSSETTSSGLPGGPCCQAGHGARGPHQPFDRFGFLTWHGKVEYQPDQ